MMSNGLRRLVAPGCIAWLAALPALAGPAVAGDDPGGLALFESKIRPVLAAECYSCHAEGAKKLRGNLRLDSREGLLAGGDSGPAIVPGKPEESLLLEALRHEGIAMPPKSKLPDAVVADFERWIAIGAPDPRDGKAAKPARSGIDVEAGRAFWAYQAPKRYEPPAAKDGSWPISPVDRFLLAALEGRGLKPGRDADRAALARRAYFDLWGLPPSPEELDAFVADPAPDAYEKLVDRLLASPHFGERWGRHWLDVARYAESMTLRGLVLKSAWRYRDYVIDAFNADMPFDQFVREQVAGDLLPSSGLDERRRRLVATMFLTLGNTNLEEQDKPQLEMDVVDEQIDVIGKAVLAQTISCARCHDHKFDPIPTKDYYAIAGILHGTRTLEHANVSKWLERPLPLPDEREAEVRRAEEAIAALESRVKQARARLEAGSGWGRSGVLAVAKLPGIVVDDAQARKVGAWQGSQHSGSYIGAGYVHDMDAGKGEKTLTFQPEIPAAGQYEVWLAYSPGGSRAAAASATIMSADGEKSVPVDMRKSPPIGGRFVSLGKYRFEANGQGYVLLSNEGTAGHVTADAVVFLPEGASASASPSAASEAEGKALAAMEGELKRLKDGAPARELAIAVEESPKAADVRVHVRGSVHNLGEVAPRGFLQVASSGPPPSLSAGESGRRELAAWLSGRENPLTARVFVNRAWHWLFGQGLVRTVDNFGTTGEAPSHPELLDDLAARFMEDGWSPKRLVRELVLSRAYRLSSADEDPKAREADPENRLLWRMNRRRLDAECIRDAILSASGRLDPRMGGMSFPESLAADYGFRAEEPRRSVYLPVFRNALPELFEAFDFADPSLVVGRRDASTVAPQALFLMNHPFAIEESRAAARRLLRAPGLDDPARIDRAYRLALGRAPTPAERGIAAGFLAGPGGAPAEESWALLFQALFASADFRSVD